MFGLHELLSNFDMNLQRRINSLYTSMFVTSMLSSFVNAYYQSDHVILIS